MKNIGIIADFDGTITRLDSNDELFKKFGNTETMEIEQAVREGRINLKDAFIEHFKRLKLTEGEYEDFIWNNIHLAKGFREFYAHVEEMKIPFAIVSGGFTNAIDLVLKRENIKGIKVYANRLVFNNADINVEFVNKIDECITSLGPCGNCKLKNLMDFKTFCKEVIFIGDGITDRCIAADADIVFAKDGLADYCKEQSIHFIPYNDFYDVSRLIFGEGMENNN